MKKGIFAALAATALSVVMSVTAFAGTWVQDSVGWWYQRDDGSYPAGKWEEIVTYDNGRESRMLYCFDEKGYLAANTWREGSYAGVAGTLIWPDSKNILRETYSFGTRDYIHTNLDGQYLTVTIDENAQDEFSVPKISQELEYGGGWWNIYLPFKTVRFPISGDTKFGYADEEVDYVSREDFANGLRQYINMSVNITIENGKTVSVIMTP